MSRTYSLSPFDFMKGALHASRRVVHGGALQPLWGVRQIMGKNVSEPLGFCPGFVTRLSH
jgi:hypothetical protein